MSGIDPGRPCGSSAENKEPGCSGSAPASRAPPLARKARMEKRMTPPEPFPFC